MSLRVFNADNDKFEKELEKKTLYLKKLRTLTSSLSDFIQELKHAVSTTVDRRKVAEKRNGITLEVRGVKHLPGSIDECIESMPCQPGVVISTDCDKRCGRGGVHIFLEKKSNTSMPKNEIDDLRKSLQRHLKVNHNTFCCELVLLKPGSLSSSTKIATKGQRFLLRDKYYQKKINNHVADVFKFDDGGDDHIESAGE